MGELAGSVECFGLVHEYKEAPQTPKGLLDILIEGVRKKKCRKESEQAIEAITWPLLCTLRISTEKELRLGREPEKTEETLVLQKYRVHAPPIWTLC